MKEITVSVDPGICGFLCKVRAIQIEKRKTGLEIIGSECGQIKRLSQAMTEISLKELFTPWTRNPIMIAAEKSGCHLSCPIPMAMIKAAEVVLGVAISKDVEVRFEKIG